MCSVTSLHKHVAHSFAAFSPCAQLMPTLSCLFTIIHSVMPICGYPHCFATGICSCYIVSCLMICCFPHEPPNVVCPMSVLFNIIFSLYLLLSWVHAQSHCPIPTGLIYYKMSTFLLLLRRLFIYVFVFGIPINGLTRLVLAKHGY